MLLKFYYLCNKIWVFIILNGKVQQIRQDFVLSKSSLDPAGLLGKYAMCEGG